MNLVYIWIEEYRNIYKKGYVMNANYTVTKSDDKDFEFVIEKKETFSIYSNDKIIDSYLLLGKNGLGKTTLLEFISYKFLNYHNQCKMFMIYEKDNNYYLYKYGLKDNITIISSNDSNSIIEYLNLKLKDENDKFNLVGIYFEGSEYPYYSCSIITSPKPLNVSIIDFIINDFNKSDESILGFDDSKDILIKYRIHGSTSDMIHTILKDSEFKLSKIMFINCFFNYFRIYNREKLDKSLYDILIEFLPYEIFENDKTKDLKFTDKFQSMIDKLEANKEKDKNIDRLFSDFKEVIKRILICFNKLTFLELKDGNIVFKLSCLLVEKNYTNLKEFLEIIDQNQLNDAFEINVSGSKGENAFLNNLAMIDTILRELKKNNKENTIVHLCIDEIEESLHPEWCRLLYSKIIKLIKTSKTKNKYYLYMSTHSPYVVSDFTSDHIINLNVQDNKSDFQTFGSNIHDILSKGMFLDNPMGEYARSMIKKVHKAFFTTKIEDGKKVIVEETNKKIVIKRLIDKKVKMKLEKNQPTSYKKIIYDENVKKILEKLDINNIYKEAEDKLLYFIDSIGEPLIKIQLNTLYKNLFNYEAGKIKISEDKLKDNMTKQEIIELLSDYNIEIN